MIASIGLAQDATYQTKIYVDSGGDRLNVASGGTIDVQSGGKFMIAGSDRTTAANLAVIAASAGKKIVGTTVSIPASGSSTVASGLTTVDYAVGSLKTLDSDHGGIATTWSSGNVTITLYAVGSTTVSTTAGTATYFAVGTP